MGMPKFSGFKVFNDSDIVTKEALFFCSDDEVTIENVKVGTFRSAGEYCEKILTPTL